MYICTSITELPVGHWGQERRPDRPDHPDGPADRAKIAPGGGPRRLERAKIASRSPSRRSNEPFDRSWLDLGRFGAASGTISGLRGTEKCLKNAVLSTKIEVSPFSASARSKIEPRASSERPRRPPGRLFDALGPLLGALGTLLGRSLAPLGSLGSLLGARLALSIDFSRSEQLERRSDEGLRAILGRFGLIWG